MADTIVLRDMHPDEGRALYRIARKSFSPIEALGASVPEHAVIAEVDGEIAGAVFLKTFQDGTRRKIGYLDLGFTVKAHRGRGVGKRLYSAAVEKLRAEGCDTIAAMVKDDNAASWGLLERQGFSQAGYAALIREFGVRLGLVLWLKTVFCIACGMNFWISKPIKRASGLTEMGSFIGVNMFFALLRAGYIALKGGDAPAGLLAWLIALCAGILSGYVGTLFGGGKWRFALTRGGGAVSGFWMLFGTFFPQLGRWYPQQFENTPKQKAALGKQALCEWAILLVLYSALALFAADIALWNRAAQYVGVVMYCRIIAIYPFEYFGGARIFAWNKVAFCVIALATIACTALL